MDWIIEKMDWIIKIEFFAHPYLQCIFSRQIHDQTHAQKKTIPWRYDDWQLFFIKLEIGTQSKLTSITITSLKGW